MHTVGYLEISGALPHNKISDIRQNVNSQWTCTLSLRLTNSLDGSTRQIQFGQAITDKSEVTERIRMAQRVSAEVFLSGAESDFGHFENSFSSDCIVLQNSGPDVTDLNFIDLPGWFIDAFLLFLTNPHRPLRQWSGL